MLSHISCLNILRDLKDCNINDCLFGGGVTPGENAGSGSALGQGGAAEGSSAVVKRGPPVKAARSRTSVEENEAMFVARVSEILRTSHRWVVFL